MSPENPLGVGWTATSISTGSGTTPDGRRLVSASNDQTLTVWDLESGRALANLQGHADWVTTCAVTPDGRRVVSASSDKMLKVWDLESARAVATLQGHDDWVTACAVLPNERVVSASKDETLKVWDLEDGRTLATLKGHDASVTACAVTPDGRRMVSASEDQTLIVWDLESWRALATLQAHVGSVLACAMTLDGRRVVSASSDRTLKVWDIDNARVVATLQGHADWVRACAITPDGRLVVSASYDKTLKVWDIDSGRALATLRGHADVVTACATTPDGRHVVSASSDKTLKVWDLDCRELTTAQGHTSLVLSCAMTPDSRHVISASADQTLKLWSVENGRELATLRGHAGGARACAVTPDGQRMISASSDKTLKMWDLESGCELVTLQGHAGSVLACTVTRDGRQAVSASNDGTLKIWDLESGRELATLRGHATAVTACAVTPDGRCAVSASNDQTLKAWDLKSGRELATLRGHAAAVTACTVTPDGLKVVSASNDQTLKVWDLESGQQRATLEGHGAGVVACAVTPNGRYVVSASKDETLKVWELESATCVFTHRVDTPCIALATNATTVVAGDAVGSLWILDWPQSLSHLAAHYVAGSENGDRDSLLGVRDPLLRLPTNRHTILFPATNPIETDRRALEREAHTIRLELSPRPSMKHTILFLAANPVDTDRLALAEECAAIERELCMAPGRDDFDFRSKWAVSVDELMHHLNELQPTILHFCGHGGACAALLPPAQGGRHRDVGSARGAGIFLQDDGRSQYVSEHALAKMVASASPSTRIVVLNACYSAPIAESLRHEVGCVVGMDGSLGDDDARAFSVAFYRALGNRRSVGNAVAQAVATLEAKQLPNAQPVCRTRDDVRADQLFLHAMDRGASNGEESPMNASRHSATAAATRARGASTTLSPNADIGIVTIRDDEFRAVLAAFPDKAGIYKGTRREYSLRHADAGGGERYRVAVLRLVEQGHGEAQDAARDLIDDLAPRLVLVVGIAGGLPSDDLKLGDVVVSTRLHDFTVEARKAGKAPTYAVTGGPIDRALGGLVANLAAREDELGDWTTDLPSPPPVAWDQLGQLVGPSDWQHELRDKLELHYGAGSTARPPRYLAGPIATSDRLAQDPELLFPWLHAARSLLAIEMESGGVYRAARERCPMLAIRGISDIVGLKRADAWTKFACASAAAFARAFLRTRPVDVGSATATAVVPS